MLMSCRTGTKVIMCPSADPVNQQKGELAYMSFGSEFPEITSLQHSLRRRAT